jgi:hypothetical protein
MEARRECTQYTVPYPPAIVCLIRISTLLDIHSSISLCREMVLRTCSSPGDRGAIEVHSGCERTQGGRFNGNLKRGLIQARTGDK